MKALKDYTIGEVMAICTSADGECQLTAAGGEKKSCPMKQKEAMNGCRLGELKSPYEWDVRYKPKSEYTAKEIKEHCANNFKTGCHCEFSTICSYKMIIPANWELE